MSRIDRDMRTLVDRALEQGWTLHDSRRGRHPKLVSPDGRRMIPVSISSSDHRARLNFRSQLRRLGVDC